MHITDKSFALAGIACLLAAPLFAQDPAAKPASSPANDSARFLAGLAPVPGSSLEALSKQSEWLQHAKSSTNAWASLEKNQLSKVRAWSKTNMPEAHATKGTVYYMFSGPDYLYADTFFPDGGTYVLCGMEPIGTLPDVAKVSPKSLGGELHTLQSSINSLMDFSFFITKKMKDDFQHHAFNGTAPVLYIFLARTGKTIIDASYVSLDAEGALTEQEDGKNTGKSLAPGVRIHFTSEGSATPRTLYYFCTDISDGVLKKSGFQKFCKTLSPGNSCVKSASYLMHEGYFSGIRSFLLENTTTLVQDDSGIPCSFFTPDTWDFHVFGSYPGPIPLFKNCYQPKLAEYYRTTKPQPLDFGIGYRHHAKESTLMIATRKAGAAKDTPAQPAEKQPEAKQPEAAPQAKPAPEAAPAP